MLYLVQKIAWVQDNILVLKDSITKQNIIQIFNKLIILSVNKAILCRSRKYKLTLKNKFPHSSSTVQPSMFIAAPTKWRLPVISTWTWAASETSMRGRRVDIFASGLGRGREGSRPAEHHRKAWLRQLKVAILSSFIEEVVWWCKEAPWLAGLIMWSTWLSCDSDCSSSHACLLDSVLARWQSNVTVKLVWSRKKVMNRIISDTYKVWWRH